MRGYKRSNRRNKREARRLFWEKMNELDKEAYRLINRSFNASAETWGGTRCPGCGIPVRPSWVTPWTISGPRVWMHGVTAACQGLGKDFVKCPGERDWQ